MLALPPESYLCSLTATAALHLYQGVPTAGRMLAYITQLKMSKLPTSLALSSHTQQSRTAQKLSL